MYQVNFLSSDVSQTLDVSGGKGDVSNKNQTKGNAFSDAMDQHYPKKNNTDSESKNNQGGNLVSKAAEQQPLSDDPAIKIKRKNLDDAHTLPVPLPIDDETSIEKSTAADKSSNLPISFPIDNQTMSAKLIAEKAINDDAHTLPVPLPIDDESLVTKPLEVSVYKEPSPISVEEKVRELLLAAVEPVVKIKGDEHTLPVPLPVVPVQDKNSVITNVKTSNNDSAIASSYKSAANSVLQESQTGQSVAQKVESDDAVDLLKMLNGAQQLLTKSATNSQVSTPLEQSKAAEVQENKALSNTSNTQLPTDSKVSVQASNTNVTDNSTAKIAADFITNTVASDIQNKEKQLATTTDKVTAVNLVENAAKNAVVKSADNSVISTAQSEVLNTGTTEKLTRENTVIDQDLLAKQINATLVADESKAALKTEQDAKSLSNISNVSNIKESQKSNDINAKAFTVEDVKKAPDAINKMVTGESEPVKMQTAELTQAGAVELNRANANESTQPRQINQSTAAVISASSAPTVEQKIDATQKSVAFDDATKLANNADDELALMKNQGEKLAPNADKVASTFNPAINHTLDAQAARTIPNAAELAAHQEQSFENTINQLTTNTVQAQKSITALNTETIAIYRKDFADAVKDKVMVMINQKIQQVEIQLDPPEMGNIHVRVNLQNEQAAVQFIVQNQQAKEALEQNMGKLRDMLAENGVDVGDANIEQRQAKEQNSDGFEQANHSGTNEESGEGNFSENDNVVLDVVKASSTGVDYYA
mgnify:FL=1